MVTIPSARSAKRLVSRVIFETSKRSPGLREWLKPVGLRTDRACYRGQAVRVPVRRGVDIVLTHLDENYLSFELFWRGAEYYEPVTTLFFSAIVGDYETFVDVGANVGYYTLLASSRKPDLRMVAVEPNPKLHRILRDNIRSNGIAVHAVEAAVSAQTGSASLFLSPSDMSASLDPGFSDEHSGSLEVETTTLDDLILHEELPSPMLIKLDIEGRESAAFFGAQEVVRRTRPDFVVEVVNRIDRDQERFLRDNGYVFHQLTPSGFHRSESLTPCSHGDFAFLNYFLTTRDDGTLPALFRRLKSRLEGLDLAHSSAFRPDLAAPDRPRAPQ